MRRVAYALLIGIVGAGIVHIALITLSPSLLMQRKWERLERALPFNRFVRSGLPVFAPDPFFHKTACRFDLRDGPVRVKAAGPVSAWFLSIYAPDGTSLARLSDAGAPDGNLDVLVATAAQRASAPARAPLVEIEAGQALAVIEALVPDSSWSTASDAFLSAAQCAGAGNAQ